MPVRREGLASSSDGTFAEVNIEVIPVRARRGEQRLPGPLRGGRDAAGAARSADGRRAPRGPEGAHGRRRRRRPPAAGARRRPRSYLQSIIEEQEAGQRGAASANEEILSSNEELQSTNEELETAKEELQSTNEELTTVNEELQHRNVELRQVNNDLLNLFASVNIPIVMLGR